MSRMIRKPIAIPSGVDFNIEDNNVSVKGKFGELKKDFFKDIVIDKENTGIWVRYPKIEGRKEESIKKEYSSKAGLVWRLISNMVEGVAEGFRMTLLLEGVGYRSNMNGNKLTLQVGYSNDRILNIPDGLKITIEKDTKIVIEGADKEMVGEFAAIIKKQRPVEPYKGKGIRYEGQHVIRKEGKTAGKK